jgi:hypothetical protein
MGIHRSEDGGKTWSRIERLLSPQCDLAGRDFGIGMDITGGVHLPLG